MLGISSRLQIRRQARWWRWNIPRALGCTALSRLDLCRVANLSIPSVAAFERVDPMEIQWSLDWFCWENLQETHGFLPSNIGHSCKFSHHPILWNGYSSSLAAMNQIWPNPIQSQLLCLLKQEKKLGYRSIPVSSDMKMAFLMEVHPTNTQAVVHSYGYYMFLLDNVMIM